MGLGNRHLGFSCCSPECDGSELRERRSSASHVDVDVAVASGRHADVASERVEDDGVAGCRREWQDPPWGPTCRAASWFLRTRQETRSRKLINVSNVKENSRLKIFWADFGAVSMKILFLQRNRVNAICRRSTCARSGST